MGLGRRIVRSLWNPQVLVLLAAAAASVVILHELAGAMAIVTIVSINLIVEQTQMARSDKSMEALESLTTPTTRIRRDGRTAAVQASDVVVGDLAILEAGDRVAADCQLVSGYSVACNEAMLTGESVPVDKYSGDALLAGTQVVRGHGLAVVRATGVDTELAKIASTLSDKTTTPLERDMRLVAERVAIVAAIVGATMTTVALTRDSSSGDAVFNAVLAGVALAIAAIPEGLVVAVTTALAVGAQQMARRGMIVRDLRAIDALGATSVLCTDKTGTLTTGSLTVSKTWVAGTDERKFWEALLRCNSATDHTGDPLDVALADAAEQRGYSTEAQLLDEIPFDSQARSMSTLHRVNGDLVVTVKGAPDVVLARCASSETTDAAASAVETFLHDHLRVIAVAQASTGDLQSDQLQLLGVVGFEDPIRPTARDAVAAATERGVRVVMATGDDATTAAAVADRAGLGSYERGRAVELIDNSAITSPTQDQLLAADVIARTSPGTKLQLVGALRETGQVVAMIGDGVNDAPALEAADVGVAVAGDAGSDVAREAADLVVTTGDLSIVVRAIEEGRRVYRNLVSVVTYLVTGNMSEVIVVAAGIVLLPELSVPLLPVHLLWINLVTDGIPALALGLDRNSQTAVQTAPRPKDEHLLHWSRMRGIAARGLVVAGCVIAMALSQHNRVTTDELRTQIVTALIFGHVMLVFVSRSSRWSFERDWWRGRIVVAAVAGSLLLQAIAVTVAPVADALRLEPLDRSAWVHVVVAGLAPLVIIDVVRVITAALRQKRIRQIWS